MERRLAAILAADMVSYSEPLLDQVVICTK